MKYRDRGNANFSLVSSTDFLPIKVYSVRFPPTN